jgi:hypothetical protein
MRAYKIICWLLLLMAFPGRMSGQFYSTGEAPASIRWSKITTPHFKIVFPSLLSPDANKLANQLEYYLPSTIGELELQSKRKLPVLLHSASVNSNGYVTLVPQRMELIMTPPSDLSAQDWINQLTLHELRHYIQLNSLRQGFTRLLSIGLGEIGPGIVSAQMPTWFYEGDAVFNETLLSQAGRGRIPGFDMRLKAVVIDKERNYSYDKALLGSYRDYVPDQYQYGYHIVNQARSNYGYQIWAKSLRFTSRNPYLIWPLTIYLKLNYGVSKRTLYKQTIDSIKYLFNNQIKDVTYTNYSSIIHPKNSVYTNYILPVELDNRRILAIQSGLNDPGSFIVIEPAGKSRRILGLGYGEPFKYDLVEKKVVWNEIVNDPRWQQRSYSIIRTLDLETGKKRRLTRKTRYFSPDFSPDGKKIAVVEIDAANNSLLTILNAGNGKIITQIPGGKKVLQTPSWINNQEIALITIDGEGKQLESVNTDEPSWRVIISHTRFDIAQPVNFNKYMLFRSSYNGIENIYAVNRAIPSEVYQVTRSKLGAYYPSVSMDSSSLLFSDYTVNGFTICSIPLEPSLWERIVPEELPLVGPGFPKISLNNVKDSIPAISYKTTSYSKTAHIFNVHSWLPFYTDVNGVREEISSLEITPGFIVFSQNLLSTVISSFSYSYNKGYHEFRPSIQWRGWLPVIELSGQIGGPQQSLPLASGVTISGSPYCEINLRSYVPLLYTRGKSFTYIQPSVEYQRSSIWYMADDKLEKGIDYLHWKGTVINNQRMATRDIYPRWGQSVSLSLTQTPSDKGLFGILYSMQASFFVPGIFAHHALFVKGGYQKQKTGKYYMPLNRIDFPRGYAVLVSRSFTSLRFNYAFPVAYPDLALRSVLYLKRFRINLFYDWCSGEDLRESGRTFSGTFTSYGAEAVADLHLFRFMFPLSAGLRLGYHPESKRYFNELMVGMDLGSF